MRAIPRFVIRYCSGVSPLVGRIAGNGAAAYGFDGVSDMRPSARWSERDESTTKRHAQLH